MTYNGKDGYQSWKISWGLNGGDYKIGDIFAKMLGTVALANDLISILYEMNVAGVGECFKFFDKLMKITGNLLGALGFMSETAKMVSDCIENGGLDSSSFGDILFVGEMLYTLAVSVLIAYGSAALTSAVNPLAGVLFGFFATMIIGKVLKLTTEPIAGIARERCKN